MAWWIRGANSYLFKIVKARKFSFSKVAGKYIIREKTFYLLKTS